MENFSLISDSCARSSLRSIVEDTLKRTLEKAGDVYEGFPFLHAMFGHGVDARSTMEGNSPPMKLGAKNGKGILLAFNIKGI